MSGVFLVAFAWSALAVLLIGIACRTLAIARLPLHLRWELAPVPREKRKGGYGGSYLEEYEWWKRERKRSTVAPLLFMIREIFLLRSVWKHNRSLWPFSFAMHTGIYLFVGALLFHVALVLHSYELQTATIQICLDVISAMALCSYLLGTAGTIGLLLKRVFDRNLRWSNSTGTFLNLLFLAAVSVSGGYAWFGSPNAVFEVGELIGRAISFSGGFAIADPLAVHVTLLLLFWICLPFTSMIHFAAKYFTYHGVIWNDKPLNERMEREVADLLSQPVQWEARHAKLEGKGSWIEVAKEGTCDEGKQS